MMAGSGVRGLAKDTVIYGLTNIGSKFLNWLLAPFYIRVLANSAEYGIVSNLYAWVSVVLVVLTLGLETGLFRFINSSDTPNRVYATTLKVLASAVALFYLISFSGLHSIAEWLGYASHPEYIAIFVLIVGLDALLSIPFAYLRYQRRPLRFAFYKFLFITLNIGFNLFFFLLCPYLIEQGVALPTWLYRPDLGVYYIFISNLLATGIETLFMLPILRPGLRGFDRSLLLPLAKYCMPLVLLGLAGNFNKMAGQILIPMLYSDRAEGMSALGIYAGNLKIAVVMVMFMQAFRFAYDPFVFTKMKEQNSHEAYRVAMNFFTLFGLIIFLGVMYWIDLFKYIVKPEYYVGLVVVPIAMMGELLFGIYYNLSIWYKVCDRTYYGALFSIIGLFITVGIIFLGVPQWGFVVAAWASLICNLVMLLLSYFFGQRLYPIRYDMGRLTLSIVVTLLFYWLGGMIMPDSVALRIFLRTLVLLFIYLPIVGYLLAPELKSTLRQLKKE